MTFPPAPAEVECPLSPAPVPKLSPSVSPDVRLSFAVPCAEVEEVVLCLSLLPETDLVPRGRAIGRIW